MTVPKPPVTSTIFLTALTRSSGVPMTTAESSPSAIISIASSGDLNASTLGRISVPTVYSLCQRCRPCLACSFACSRLSAICQFMTTRQSSLLTVFPLFAAASSANPHCVGSACKPAVDVDPMERTPVPCLPAKVIPEGDIIEATAKGISSCNGNNCRAASFNVNHSLS